MPGEIPGRSVSRWVLEPWKRVQRFEEFIRRVESDRFKRMITGPEQFEKYLPLAMATQTGAMMASSPRSFCGSGF